MDRLERFRNVAAMFADNLLRRRLKLTRSAIVAQPFPAATRFMLVGGRELLYRRKALQEPFVVWNDRRHLRLLQHDLADPDGVQVACLSPGQIACMLAEPGKQTLPQRALP